MYLVTIQIVYYPTINISCQVLITTLGGFAISIFLRRCPQNVHSRYLKKMGFKQILAIFNNT
jgi:hypothetical protein